MMVMTEWEENRKELLRSLTEQYGFAEAGKILLAIGASGFAVVPRDPTTSMYYGAGVQRGKHPSGNRPGDLFLDNWKGALAYGDLARSVEDAPQKRRLKIELVEAERPD
jgi:hypothetical protein